MLHCDKCCVDLSPDANLSSIFHAFNEVPELKSSTDIFSSDLSGCRCGVSDALGHLSQDGHHPALTVKLLSEAAAHTAQQGGQQVLIASAELAVLQVVL